MIHWKATRRVLCQLGFIIVSSLLPGASLELQASESTVIPEKTGYFDGRLWRIGVRPNGQSRLAVDTRGRLYVTGSDLGTTAWVFPDIARWDGRRWETLATNANRVNALLPVGSDLVVAGWFTEIDGMPLNRIARFDGSGWHPMGDGLGSLNAEVLALAAADGQFYAGGRFTNAGSLSLTNIARWDIASETWHALGDGLPGEVRAIAASENGIYAGTGEQIFRWTGSTWELLGTFIGQAGSVAQILALQWRDNALYAAGSFASVDGLEASVVVRWRDGRWERPGSQPIAGVATGMDWVQDRLWLAGRLQLPDQPALSSVKVASLTGDAWQAELEVNSRFAAQALCHRGSEVFVLDMPTLKEAAYVSDLVIWHRHDHRWTPVNGGLAPVPETTGVALSLDGVAVGGVGGTCPMRYDGSEFRHTTGGPGTFGVPIQIGRSLPGSARQAYAAGSVPVNDRPLFVARLEGDLWETVTTTSPLPAIVHVAPGENRLAVAGYRTPSAGGEVWEWTGSAWKPLGDRFEPASPTGSGSNPSRIQALAWHEGRLYAGCIASTIGGQVHSNLVVWDGARWQPSVPLLAPAHLLKSAGGRLYIGSQVSRRPASILVLNGEQVEELGADLPLQALTGFDVSDEGLLAAVGNVGTPGVSPIWLRRGAAWVPPGHWTSPAPGAARGCVWFGNDLYIAGNGATASDVESMGLAIWHEPGVRVMTRLATDGTPTFRATGALPAHFVWERGDRLTEWVPFATNALGNPGWVADPLASSSSRFYRIREIGDAESGRGNQ